MLLWRCQGDGLRVDVFDKVERVFLLGLRASDPAMRRKFFDLYNSAIPVTLYDRLRFIVCSQDWEHLADTFWLKQGLVRGPSHNPPSLNILYQSQAVCHSPLLCMMVPYSRGLLIANDQRIAYSQTCHSCDQKGLFVS